MSRLRLTQQGTPSTPPSGTDDLYVDAADGLLKYVDQGGIVRIVNAWTQGSGSPVGVVLPLFVGQGYQDTSGTGNVYVATGTGDTDWSQVGGASAGVPVVRAFPFAYNDVGLSTGENLYTPTIGDILYDAWIEIDTAWDGTTPVGDIGLQTSGFNGEFGNLLFNPPYGIDMTTPDTAGGEGLLANASVSNPSLATACAIGSPSGNNGVRQVPGKFVTTDPFCVVVSQDGTTGTTPSSLDSTTPPGVLPLVVATGVNDGFGFTLQRGPAPASDPFTVAPSIGGYATTADVAAALNAALNGAAARFDATYGTWADDGSGNLSLTLLNAGGNGSTITAGSTDIVAGLGLSVSTTAGGTGGDPGSTVGAAILYLVTATPV